MRYCPTAFALLAACRINFDPAGEITDAVNPDGTPADAAPDALFTPLVQAVSLDAVAGAGLTLDGTIGLAPITAGNMVLVVCGGLDLQNACRPISTPPATWQEIDGGTTLGVFVTCNAPAITSIMVMNGGTELNVIVTEWSGVAASCYDTGKTSTACATAPTAWNSLATPTTSQNRSLIVTLGTAGSVDAGWSVDAPYAMAKDATGVNGASNPFVAYQEVDAPPMPYAGSGFVNQYSSACFNDVFAFNRP